MMTQLEDKLTDSNEDIAVLFAIVLVYALCNVFPQGTLEKHSANAQSIFHSHFSEDVC